VELHKILFFFLFQCYSRCAVNSKTTKCYLRNQYQKKYSSHHTT